MIALNESQIDSLFKLLANGADGAEEIEIDQSKGPALLHAVIVRIFRGTSVTTWAIAHNGYLQELETLVTT